MSFKKSELQALRSLLSKKIDEVGDDIAEIKSYRNHYFEASNKEDPSTEDFYKIAKSFGNRYLALLKKKDKYEALLYKVKHEMKAEKETLFEKAINFIFSL